MTTRFTTSIKEFSARNLPSGTTRVSFTETAGFYLHIGRTSATWYLQKRISKSGNAPVTFRLGKAWGGKSAERALTPATAARKAHAWAHACSAGQDPRKIDGTSKQMELANQKGCVRLDQLATYFLENKKVSPGTKKAYAYAVEKYLMPWLKGRNLLTVKDEETLTHYKELKKGGKLGRARQAMKVLSSMWNFGINHFRGPDNEPLLIVNPVEVAKKTIERWEYPATPRRPIIDINHIGRFVATLEQRLEQNPSPESSKPYNERQGCFLLLLCLFTGMRVGEAIRLKWDDVNLDAGYLDLELTKNGRSHRVIFSSYVWALMRKIKNTRTKISPYVFPLWSNPSRHIYRNLPVVKELSNELELYFGTHSMRRTFRGVCRTLKMDPDDVKRLLNHRHKGDVTDQYDSGFNPDLPRQYWQQVSDFLEEKRNLFTGDTATCQHNGAQLVAWLSDQGLSLDEAATLIAHMQGATTTQAHPTLKLAG